MIFEVLVALNNCEQQFFLLKLSITEKRNVSDRTVMRLTFTMFSVIFLEENIILVFE